MYKVYWTENEQDANVAFSQDFGTTEMVPATQFMEQLRRARRQGAPISFVGLVSEHPDSVGQAGVDSVKDGLLPDGKPYEWRKRRP